MATFGLVIETTGDPHVHKQQNREMDDVNPNSSMYIFRLFADSLWLFYKALVIYLYYIYKN